MQQQTDFITVRVAQHYLGKVLHDLTSCVGHQPYSAKVIRLVVAM